MEHDPKSTYTLFLKECLHSLDVGTVPKGGISFIPPPDFLIVAYMLYLDKTKNHPYSTIDSYTSALYSTSAEMDSPLKVSQTVKQMLKKFLKKYKAKGSDPFCITEDLPKMYVFLSFNMLTDKYLL